MRLETDDRKVGDVITDLQSLLREVRTAGGVSFSGIGVIVTRATDRLPIMSLRECSDLIRQGTTLDVLAVISQESSDCHDGFHVLSPALELKRISVYFSPPIIASESADDKRRLGGRYWAARFGSALPDVLATGVASATYGVVIFRNGREIET
jgi:hypothetical protein